MLYMYSGILLCLCNCKQKVDEDFVHKKDLFRKKKGLQSSTCRHDKPCAQRWRNYFIEGKREFRGEAVTTTELL